MNTVTSADGTPIAYDRFGEGEPVILVGGATCDRAMTRPLAEELGRDCAVLNYDRRGRGDSGDSAEYAVDREIEDLGALIAEAGETASLYGHSSGAGVVIHAAAAGLPIDRVVLHEAPYVENDEMRRAARAYAANLESLLREGRRGDVVELFFTTVGMPPEMVDGIREGPRWAELEAIAPTLAYDSMVMGDRDGGTIPADLLGAVGVPGLVLCGGASPDWMIDIGRRIADAMPNGRCRVLEGEEHVVAPEVLAPVLAEFIAGAPERTGG